MNAHVKPADVKALPAIPQAYDQLGELVNVRTLLKAGRNAEALERLERALNRNWGSWRCGA